VVSHPNGLLACESGAMAEAILIHVFWKKLWISGFVLCASQTALLNLDVNRTRIHQKEDHRAFFLYSFLQITPARLYGIFSI
jgi:hypothetical protein